MDDMKAPLLQNSVTSLKCEFISKLPHKVRSGLDPETPLDIDLSKLTGFIQGEKEYYEKQFATLKSFEEVDSLESNNAIDEEQYCIEQVQHERAMNISNCANFVLLAFKVFYFPFYG
ncbi:hypothetical protein Patl1_32925 [Pistacia atlantica]|uniref:Uncharacterized protein n=1 Tax=Pistacia atlantica TaxID=434234 RepID=A0ACC1ANP0_9ROSI|nr:hypothetical protein Patl1_32925 [Pistacia atlantica]